jgi:hypothetical protein
MSAQIFIPGKGMIDLAVVRVDRAVREYDERLFFDLNSANGQYAVFIRMPHGKPPHPVMGYGFEVPEPHEVIKKLYQNDGLRFGEEILDQAYREMKQEQAEKNAVSKAVAEETAEVMESYHHRQGHFTKYHRSTSKAKESKRTGG